MDDKPKKVEPDAVQQATDPPVVARLVIEIRSDGTRTVARGAAEDVLRGETVQVHAAGDSPLALALSLARALKDLPALARGFAKGFLKK